MHRLWECSQAQFVRVDMCSKNNIQTGLPVKQAKPIAHIQHGSIASLLMTLCHAFAQLIKLGIYL